MSVRVGLLFGVPLHAEDEGIIRRFERLDDAVVRVSRGLQPLAQILHRLVMETVDPRLGAVEFRQDGAVFDPDPVAWRAGRDLRLAVLLRAFVLRDDILVQRAAEGDVQDLGPSADAQNGLFDSRMIWIRCSSHSSKSSRLPCSIGCGSSP